MGTQILNHGALDAERQVRPAHTRADISVQQILIILRNILEVIDSSVVVILAREKACFDICRVRIRNWVRMRVPAAKAKIQATHEGKLSINKQEFLVVG